jgi:hypothetical protein
LLDCLDCGHRWLDMHMDDAQIANITHYNPAER